MPLQAALSGGKGFLPRRSFMQSISSEPSTSSTSRKATISYSQITYI